MAAIMQRTTPSITITIDPDDFQLSAVTKIELKVRVTITQGTHVFAMLGAHMAC